MLFYTEYYHCNYLKLKSISSCIHFKFNLILFGHGKQSFCRNHVSCIARAFGETFPGKRETQLYIMGIRNVTIQRGLKGNSQTNTKMTLDVTRRCNIMGLSTMFHYTWHIGVQHVTKQVHNFIEMHTHNRLLLRPPT